MTYYQSFFESYQTAEWQRKKNAVLERDNYTCQICGSTSGIMQVHHITYKNCNGLAYNAAMGDLITLCPNCHNNDDGDHVHFYDGAYKIERSWHGLSAPKVYRNPFSTGGRSAFTRRAKEFDWNEFKGVILSFVAYSYNYRSIGFFESCQGTNAWFTYILGIDGRDNPWVADEFNLDEFEDIRPANRDETSRFVEHLNLSGLDFGETVKLKKIKSQELYFVDISLFHYKMEMGYKKLDKQEGGQP